MAEQSPHPVADNVRRLGPTAIPYDFMWRLVQLAEAKQYQPCGRGCCSSVCEAWQLTEDIKHRIEEAGVWRDG